MDDIAFKDRREFEAPDGAFQVDPNLMQEDPPMDEPEEQSGQQADQPKVTCNTGEKKMSDEEREIPVEEDEPAAPPKKGGKTARAAGARRKIRLLIVVALLAIVCLVFAYLYFMVASQTPQTLTPQAISQAQPQKQRQKVRPQNARPSTANASEQESAMGAMDLALALDGKNVDMPQSRPQASRQSHQQSESVQAPQNRETDLTIMAELKELLPTLKNLAADLARLSETGPAAGSRSDMKEAVAAMTAEIQNMEKVRKKLEGDLEAANRRIQALAKENDTLKKSRRGQSRAADSRDKKAGKDTPNGTADTAAVSGWEILGFSGNRVVISDERGTHSINVGNSYNGVKILSIDVEGGTVRTSAGLLRYGQ